MVPLRTGGPLGSIRDEVPAGTGLHDPRDTVTIHGRLDAYRRGELTLGELVDELPIVSDASPDLMELLDALEAGRVPPEVVAAWSHPGADNANDAEVRAAMPAPVEPSARRDRPALRANEQLLVLHRAPGTSPDRAWKFLPKPLVD